MTRVKRREKHIASLRMRDMLLESPEVQRGEFVKYFNCLMLCLSFALAVPSAQPVFRGSEIFPPEEFAARRAKVFDQLGDAVAIVLGTTQPPGEMPFRQNNQFFYLAGSAEPRSYLILDSRTRRTTMF